MMALAFITAYFVLGREIRLRHLKIDPYSVVAYVALAGIVGAKIWHVIDTPDDRLDWATLHSLPRLVSWLRGGVAWFGGFVAGIATLLLLARHYRVKLLTMLDLSSPALRRRRLRPPHQLVLALGHVIPQWNFAQHQSLRSDH